MMASPYRGTITLPLRPGTAQPSPGCPLLDLPVEVMLLVAESLPPLYQMVLAQTCRPLWVILHSHMPLNLRPAAWLGCNQRLEYLSCLVRSDPQVWLCDSCHQLQRVTEAVLARNYEPCRTRPPAFVSCPGLCLHYHHVQLALKASRMAASSPACRRQLQRLLAPHHTTQWYANPQDDLSSRFTARPRIVADRFLLLSEWDYTQCRPDTPVTRDAVGPLSVCAHLFTMGDIIDPFDKRYSAFAAAVDAAMATPDAHEFRGSCSRCATDFAIEAGLHRLTLRTWRNLGPEGSPMNPDWRAQVDFMTSNRNHQRGRVRELYERGE